MTGTSPVMTFNCFVPSCRDAQPEGPAGPHPQRPVDAKDHRGDEDGRGLAAAPRAGAGRGGAALCPAHGARAGLARRAHDGAAERAAAARRHRQGRDPSDRRRDLRSRPRRRLQRLDPARGAAPHPRARSGRQEGHDPDHRPQGARRAAPRLWPADPRQPDRYRAPRLSFDEARDIAERILVLFAPASSTSARSSTTASARRSPRS